MTLARTSTWVEWLMGWPIGLTRLKAIGNGSGSGATCMEYANDNQRGDIMYKCLTCGYTFYASDAVWTRPYLPAYPAQAMCPYCLRDGKVQEWRPE